MVAKLATQLLEIVVRSPGHTDRELAVLLRGPGALQQAINQEARLLASRGLILRQKRPDGVIGNYPSDSDATSSESTVTRKKPAAVPSLPDFTHADVLISVVASYVRLPHPGVVDQLGGAVFPSIRDQKNRLTLSNLGDRRILLDDNTTPRWAMLWSHGYATTAHPTGWTFAHVWGRPKDPDCYTHVANLAMMPEYLASLSDKDGPLGAYLRYHAWEKYGWKPIEEDDPQRPEGYEAISWCYLREEIDPRGFISSRVQKLDNERCKILRSLNIGGRIDT